MTTEQVERRLDQIRIELEALKLVARKAGDRALERQIDAAWRELNMGKAAFV
jgi:hypothetical protein